MVQLSHPYMTTGKTVAVTVQTFVGKGNGVGMEDGAGGFPWARALAVRAQSYPEPR